MNSGWLYKLERKFGKYSIPGLIKYVLAAEVIGAVIGLVNPLIYLTFLSLDFSAIFRGQVWRLFSFVLVPRLELNMWSIIVFAIEILVYYFVGTSLERAWGSFRFNLFYLSGIVLSWIAALLVYLTIGVPYWPVGLEYINETLFLAFALLFPDVEFLLFFLLPIKAKWLGIVYGVIMGFEVVGSIMAGGYIKALAITIQLLNFFIFFISTKKGSRGTYQQRQQRREFKQQTSQNITPLFRHRCAICGRTERDNPNLEFRFCSKCDGNYEYCSDHIFTHEHVRINR